MRRKNTYRIVWLVGVLCSGSLPVSLHAFIFDSIMNDLLVLEKINEENRAQLVGQIKKFWSAAQSAGEAGEERSLSMAARRSIESQTFDDLPGMPEDIREVVDFFKNSERFTRVGARMPRGILLYGPPGTGKTSVARVIAKQCGAAFFPASASSFMEIYVGAGPQHVRKLFDDARVHKRSVIFIDEIDAIGASRSLGYGDHSERTNTLNELLNQMDGFVEKPGLLVIAATNRVDILDEALLRPGRFDRLIKLDLPDCAVRRAILERYCACVPFAGTHVCLDEVAQQSEGLSGAELKNIVDEAAIYAARENAESVDDAHIRKAHAKVLARPRRGRGR